MISKRHKEYFEKRYSLSRLFESPRIYNPSLLHLIMEQRETNKLLNKLVKASKSNKD